MQKIINLSHQYDNKMTSRVYQEIYPILEMKIGINTVVGFLPNREFLLYIPGNFFINAYSIMKKTCGTMTMIRDEGYAGKG